jgi:hypothetical protein
MILLFEKASISATSVAAASTGVNLDFWMVPAANLLTISAIQGQIILYFRDGNPYSETLSTGEALTGSFRFATITFNVTTGKESEVAENFYKFILAGPKAIVPIPSVRQIFKFSNVTSKYADIPDIVNIDNIRRYTTYDAITGTGSGGLPIGGDLDQVLTKLSSVDGDVAWVYPHTLFIRVRNTSGGTLPKGTPVHATGVTGTVPDVIAADAAIPSAMPATYVLNQSIANNAQGVAIIVGTITGVDTSTFSAGDVVFVAAGGGFTNVKPTGTNLIQNLGVVTRSNVTTGSGVVYGAGRSNDVPNLPTGKFFIGSATNTVESSYTLPTADGTLGQQLQTNGAGVVTFQNPNPRIIYSNANKVDHTGTLVATLISSFLVPANTLNAGDLLYLISRSIRTGAQSNTATMRYYINTTNSLSGATLIGTNAAIATAGRLSIFERTYAVLNQTTNTNAFVSATQALTDVTSSTIAPTTLTIDWTTDQYIIINATLLNAADNVSLIYFLGKITKQKL